MAVNELTEGAGLDYPRGMKRVAGGNTRTAGGAVEICCAEIRSAREGREVTL